MTKLLLFERKPNKKQQQIAYYETYFIFFCQYKR